MVLKGGPELNLLRDELSEQVRQKKITPDEMERKINDYLDRSAAVVKRGMAGELSGCEVNEQIKKIADECAGVELLWPSQKKLQATKDGSNNAIRTNSDSLGMKWYTFYIDGRPWVALAFFLLSVFVYWKDYLTAMNINIVGAAIAIPTIIFVAAYVAHIVVIFVLAFRASNTSGEPLFRFIKGLLIFEVFFVAYDSFLGQYIVGQSITSSLVVMLIAVAIDYLVWYRLNIKYFRKRLVFSAPVEQSNENQSKEPTLHASIEPPRHVERTPEELAQLKSDCEAIRAAIQGELDELAAKNGWPTDSSKAAPHGKKQKVRYCRKCGNIIDPTTKKCTGCGKQYLRLSRVICACAVTLLFLASAGLNVYMYSIHAEAQETITELTKENEDLFDEVVDLNIDLMAHRELANFCDKHVVFVEDDGSGLYHKFECNRFKGDSFWVFNTNAAENRGYEPCPICCD